MLNYLKSLFTPKVNSIMSSFNTAIKALESVADIQADLASDYKIKADAAQVECDRAEKLALKLKAAFTI